MIACGPVADARSGFSVIVRVAEELLDVGEVDGVEDLARFV